MAKVLTLCLTFMLCIASAIIVMGCNDGVPADKKTEAKLLQESNYKVTDVEGSDIMFNDTEAGAMINFKSDEIEHCSLVFVKSILVQGYSTRITDLGYGDLDLTCLMADQHYAMTNNGDTYVQLNIDELGEKVVVKLDFNLYSIRSKKILTKENVVLVVSNNQIKSLIDDKSH